MKTTIIALIALLSATIPALAYDNASVFIQPENYADNGFWCNGKNYGSDISLKDFHGCDAEHVTFGQDGSHATLLRAHYGWTDGGQPKTETFIELQNGHLFRLRDTRFLKSPRVQQYFKSTLGLTALTNSRNTTLDLGDVSTKNFSAFGDTFCLYYHLKMPFYGTMGWCQGDTILGGDIGYRQGVLPFAEAAITAQTFIYDRKLRTPNQQLMQKHTLTHFNEDMRGYHWAFAVPATVPTVGAYKIKVYMDGYTTVEQLRIMPNNPNAL